MYYNNFKILSAEYDKKPNGEEKEVIRDSQILRSGIPEDIWNIWNRIDLGFSLNLIINGTFSYNAYPDLIQIENKGEFNFQYYIKS